MSDLTATTSMRATVRSAWPVALWQLLAVGALIAVWELVTATGLLGRDLLASPAAAAAGLVHVGGATDARGALLQTLRELGFAFLVGMVAGLVVGVALGRSDLLRRAYLGPATFIMSTPKVVFLPVFTLLLGLGPRTAEWFGAFEAFFYVVVNVAGAVGQVDERFIAIGRSYRAGALATFTEIILPASAPGLLAAVWYGLRQSLVGVVVAELYASVGGIGQLITTYDDTLQLGDALGLVLAVSIVAVVVGSGFRAVERRLGLRLDAAGRERLADQGGRL